MNCAWQALLSILPSWMRSDVDKQGRDRLQELRLRLHAPPELRLGLESVWMRQNCTAEDLSFCINSASRYSPWVASTAAKGYITAPGGHRIGMCGEAVCRNDRIEGIKNLTSLCIRVARDFPGISEGITPHGSLIILGAPGWGKTTLLRDLIRRRSNRGTHIAVLDERGELFPSGMDSGKRTDILTGCTKAEGMTTLLRTMGPDCIAVDEITEEADCRAALNVFGCGVDLLATAHASSLRDFLHRNVYRPLLENKVFQTAVVLHADKSWHLERMT